MRDPKRKVTALEIKHAVMFYYRFKRQCLCATECLDNDVMVVANKNILDVEIKISKYDLWKGEARKPKHNRYKDEPGYYQTKTRLANKFYICVPKDLIEEATKWAEETNDKYGIIMYEPEWGVGNNIIIMKSAKTLHKDDNSELQKSIMMRVCSENIGLIGKKLEKGIK